jgi:hypothetical protein
LDLDADEMGTIAEPEDIESSGADLHDPETLDLSPEDMISIEPAAMPAYPASDWGTACRMACWAAAGMGCAAVGASCTGTTVFTIGGTTIPCTWAMIAACGSAGAGAQYCAERLCPP